MLQTLYIVKMQGARLHVTGTILCKDASAITCYRYMLQTLHIIKLQGAMLHVTDMIHCKDAGAITCYRHYTL